RYEDIFSGSEDYQAFVELLKESSAAWNLRVTAYCLMPNHYHLLVQTPDGNISRCMRHLNGVYTQSYNRRHKCDGPLFRGRYKSILVSADNYLLQLVRYIHNNPKKAGLVKNPNQYEWSSHKGYLSTARKWEWLNKQFILSMLTLNENDRIRAYKNLMKTEDDEAITGIFDDNKWPLCLGTSEFTDWVRATFFGIKTDAEEIPHARSLAPKRTEIIEAVCSHYGVEAADLLVSRRGYFNEPRNAGIFLFRRLRRERLKEIGHYFHIAKYSSVSSIIERLRARMDTDRKLKNRVDKIYAKIIKSQGQT
ncbi:MAG: transposase, partial [Desulfobacteraceae bacterium]|nr:transposase [Desulfobacteraceae bacterium]